jgi:C_GCAxxG_C_C family probable redox protein
MSENQKIVELTRNYWEKRSNCAQSTAAGILENYDHSDLSPSFYKAMLPFGGGVGEESICGAVLGSLAGMSLALADKGVNPDGVREKSKEFKRRLRERFGTLECGALMDEFRDPQGKIVFDMPGRREKCTKVVESAVILARQLIDSSQG